MLDLLKNDIVINWIAPIITGLIVVVIPTVIVKIFTLKKDEKTIKGANQRYLDSIMPFIIQKIEISSSYITDIRNVIIEESRLKDKYVYSELNLRNKLVMDISESKYVDEGNKKELIDFTYETFKSFTENKCSELQSEESDSKKIKFFFDLITNPLIILILSQLIITIVVIFDKRGIKPEENVLILLPFFLGFVSILGVVAKMFSKIFESNVSRNKSRNEFIYNNYITHRNEIAHRVTQSIRPNNNKTKNND